MKDDKQDANPLDSMAGAAQHAAQVSRQLQHAAGKAGSGAAKTAAHTSQAAHSAVAAAKGGAAAAGATTGTALAGPLGTVVGTIVTSKTFWKVLAAILLTVFLFAAIIANMFGILLTYLGFANADDFANQAQSEELAAARSRVERILEDDSRKKEILAIIEKARDSQLQEIRADKAANYADHELQVIDEYETKLKKNLSYYLAVFLMDTWGNGELQSFLGYPNGLGVDMTTDLTSPYDNFFAEASQAYGVPKALLVAIAKAESDFNPSVISGAGAIGIMQLMPGTAASLGVDPYDPRQNIMGGAKYIAGNIEQFKDFPNGLELAVAAYNAGPGAVIKYGYQIPPYQETQNYVRKVLGYVQIQGPSSAAKPEEGQEEDLNAPFAQLKEAVAENADRFFSWSVTDEKETETMKTSYYFLSESGKTEIGKETYEKLKAEGGKVTTQDWPLKAKMVEYTLALMLNTQPAGGGTGYEYKYVTDKGTFEFMLKVLRLLSGDISAMKDLLFANFSWTDFVTGGSSGGSIPGNIDATGVIITYDTVGKGQKKVVYFNQGEDPWGSMPYGQSTIGAAGCGPTSMAIVISTLNHQTVTPRMTCDFSIANGEYVYGAGTAHSFVGNAAAHWGLTCERVGKDRMDYVVQSLKDGKMVVEICEAYTITGSGSGHFIVLTGVTREGYITIADCASRERTGKVYSVETIKSFGRDLSEGAFWIIGK